MRSRHPVFHLITFGALALLAGCKDKEEIKVYRVSKETEAPPMAQMENAAHGAMPGMPGATSPAFAAEAVPELTGTPPPNWEAQAPSSMRQASFLVKGENGATADVSLVVMGGAAGGDIDNVNRWLTQLGQAEITGEKLKEMARHITTPLGDVLLVDLEGLPPGADTAKDGRILAGIASSDGKTCFFKMRGNAALVESQKDGFAKWVGSVHLSDPGKSPAAGPAATAAPLASAGNPKIEWQVPEGWNPAQASSMRYASFAVAGQNGEAGDISVSVFPGDTGGDLANVNRWRGQVGLEQVTDAELQSMVTKVSGAAGEIMLVDLAGQKSRVLAGWTRKNGSTWFFKLTGPDALVGGEKEKFTKFLQSVQFRP